ncbi:MAG: hypothetical protein IJM32_06060 [Ruminococcus sp.]|nr:hypothetical protein [Ruminococcus sp.]
MRRVFADVLKSGGVNIEAEYERLYSAFYNGGLRKQCSKSFMQYPFRGTCVSLSDFDDSHGFHFEDKPESFDLENLINFCEYTYNLVICMVDDYNYGVRKGINHRNGFLKQIIDIVDMVNYEIILNEDGIAVFVPKNSVANLVSEIVPENISYKIIEYNHHSMKGNLASKKATLKLLADQLEAKRAELKKRNGKLEDDLFFLFNNINIRHNNTDPESKYYKEVVASMTDDELEERYDLTYETCLYAFMTLEQAENANKIKNLKDKINNK